MMSASLVPQVPIARHYLSESQPGSAAPAVYGGEQPSAAPHPGHALHAWGIQRSNSPSVDFHTCS